MTCEISSVKNEDRQFRSECVYCAHGSTSPLHMNQRWPIRRGRSSGLGSPNARLPRLGTTAIAVNCGPPLSSIPSSGLLFRSLNIPHSFPTSMELELAPKANRIEADQRQLQLWWCCCWFLLPLIFIVVRIWNRKRSTNILWVSLGLGSTFLLVPLDSGHCIPGVLNQVQVVHGYAHCSRFFFFWVVCHDLFEMMRCNHCWIG